MKIAALFASLASVAFGTSFAQGQCPSCEAAPALDCRINFDGEAVPLTTYKQFGCRADVVASYGEGKVNTCRRTFGPPFMLIDSSVVDHSSNNGWRSASRYASGAKVDFKEQIDEAYDQAIDLAGKYGDKAAEAKLQEMKKRHVALSLQYSVNQDSVELKVEASGHGWALDRKRGWQDSSIEVTVACIAPVNLFEQVMANAGLKGDQVTLRNNSPSAIYAHYAIQDDKAKSCSSAKPAITARLNVRQVETLRVPVNGKLCVHYYSKMPTKPSLSPSCELTPAPPVNIGPTLPAQCAN